LDFILDRRWVTPVKLLDFPIGSPMLIVHLVEAYFVISGNQMVGTARKQKGTAKIRRAGEKGAMAYFPFIIFHAFQSPHGLR